MNFIACLKEAILEDFVDGDCIRLSVERLKVNNKCGREGCWRKLRAELDL